MATRDYWFAFGSGNPSTYTGLAPTFIKFVDTSGGATTPPSIAESPAGSGLYKSAYQPNGTICFVLDGATTGLASADRYIAGVMDPLDLMGGTLVATGTSLLAMGTTLLANGVLVTQVGTTLLSFAAAQGTSMSAMGSTAINNGNLTTNFGTSFLAFASGQGSSTTAIGSTLVAVGNTLTALAGFIGSTASSYGSTGIDPTTVFGFLIRAQEMREGNQTYTKSTGVLDFFTRGGTLIREKTISDTSTQTTKT
jgi:hypothetical protein